jgi:RNA polymerase subunit RPABC4/transcription elongation factor Spt4
MPTNYGKICPKCEIKFFVESPDCPRCGSALVEPAKWRALVVLPSRKQERETEAQRRREYIQQLADRDTVHLAVIITIFAGIVLAFLSVVFVTGVSK